MTRDILIDTSFGEIRAAIMEEDELAELFIENAGHLELTRNIYRGKVERVLPGMQSAFVDIGTGKNAFLYADDILPDKAKPDQTGKIENLVSQGQEVTVQVIKEAVDSKGPKVTTNITLAGHAAILCPKTPGIGISKKIKSTSERERLRMLAEKLCPEGMGIIVRTAAESIEESELEEDIKHLTKLWVDISGKEAKGPVPRCLYTEPGVIYKLIRDFGDAGINRIILNDRAEYERLFENLETVSPGLRQKVEYFCKDYEMFQYYNIDAAINKALARKVWLKSGGYLVFDKTEALTVIDVNTGKFVGRDTLEETIIRINEEAARTIAKQIRLRNISGIILVDFIDMEDTAHKEELLSVLRDAVKEDKRQVVVVGMTGLGLVEMTRKKERNSLQQLLTLPCPTCGGLGRVNRVQEEK